MSQTVVTFPAHQGQLSGVSYARFGVRKVKVYLTNGTIVTLNRREVNDDASAFDLAALASAALKAATA